jgi:hypothetical protein
MENLVQLLVNNDELTDESGKQFQGTPIGNPQLLTIPRDGNDFDRDRMELPSSMSSDSILTQEIENCKPKIANAYVIGERKPIVHDMAPEHCDDYFAYPLQFYKI